MLLTIFLFVQGFHYVGHQI